MDENERLERAARNLFSAAGKVSRRDFSRDVMARLREDEAPAWVIPWARLAAWKVPAYGMALAASLILIRLAQPVEAVTAEALLLDEESEESASSWLTDAQDPGPDELLGSSLEDR